MASFGTRRLAETTDSAVRAPPLGPPPMTRGARPVGLPRLSSRLRTLWIASSFASGRGAGRGKGSGRRGACRASEMRVSHLVELVHDVPCKQPLLVVGGPRFDEFVRSARSAWERGNGVSARCGTPSGTRLRRRGGNGGGHAPTFCSTGGLRPHASRAPPAFLAVGVIGLCPAGRFTRARSTVGWSSMPHWAGPARAVQSVGGFIAARRIWRGPDGLAWVAG